MVDKRTTFTGVAVLFIACIFISESAVINVKNYYQAKFQTIGYKQPCYGSSMNDVYKDEILPRNKAPLSLKLANLASYAYIESDRVLRRKLNANGYTNPITCRSARSDTEGFVTSDNTGVYVSFRGTEGVSDVMTDLNFRSVSWPYGRTCRSECVHNGFYNAFVSIHKECKNAVYNKRGRSSKQIYITGHSLGAAIATLFANELYDINRNMRNDDIINLYTFGSPPVGNPAFTSHFNRLHITSYIITIVGDGVSYKKCTLGKGFKLFSNIFDTYRKPKTVYYLPNRGGHDIDQYIGQLKDMVGSSSRFQGMAMSYETLVEGLPGQDDLPYDY